MDEVKSGLESGPVGDLAQLRSPWINARCRGAIRTVQDYKATSCMNLDSVRNISTETASRQVANADLGAIAMEATDFHFVDPWIPHLVRCAGDVACIDAPAKVLLRELCEYVTIGGGDQCSVSLARLALRIGHSKSWVRTQISKLERSGLVSIVANRRGGAPGQTPVYSIDRRLLRQRAAEGRDFLEKALLAAISQRTEERQSRTRKWLAAKLDAEAEQSMQQEQESILMQTGQVPAQHFSPIEYVFEQDGDDRTPAEWADEVTEVG